MTPRITRLSRLAALTVALTALGSPALASGSAAGLSYVPADFSTVVSVDFNSLRSSAAFSTLEGQLLEGFGVSRDIKQLTKETGFDLLRDLKGMVYAGPDALVRDDEQFIMILEAKYDPAKLIAYLDKAGAKMEAHGTGPSRYFAMNNNESRVAFHEGFIIAGPSPLFDRAMKAKSSGNDIRRGPLGELIAKFARYKSGFAVIGGNATLNGLLTKEFSDLAGLTLGAGGFDLSKGLAISTLGRFSDAKRAAELSEKIKGFIKEMNTDPEVQEVGLDKFGAKVNVTAKGTELKVSLGLSSQELSELVEILMAMVGGE